jgi:hypothetical protein
MKQTAAITLLLTALGVGALAQSQSSITSLSRKACRELKVDSKDRLLYRGRCPGVGGFKLEIDTGEDQEAVELVSPKGKHFDVSIHPVAQSR